MMKRVLPHREFLRSPILRGLILLPAIACIFGITPLSAQQMVLFGHTADFESQIQRFAVGLPSVTAVRGGHAELRIAALDIGGFVVEEARPIFQFDVSAMGNYAASATLSIELLSVAATEPFSIELWGFGSNRSAPLNAGDIGAAQEFGNLDYQQIANPWTVPMNETAQPGTFSMDITQFLNDRWEAYLADDNSWIYFRLQSADSFLPGSGVDATFSIASADHVIEGNRPRIDAVIIPEPRRVALCFAVAVFAIAVLRRSMR